MPESYGLLELGCVRAVVCESCGASKLLRVRVMCLRAALCESFDLLQFRTNKVCLNIEKYGLNQFIAIGFRKSPITCCNNLANQSWVEMSHVKLTVRQDKHKSTNDWLDTLCALPNLTLDMVSQTGQKSTNPWISVPYALT
jgi:hypothetical protein